MADISQDLQKILDAIYGEEVRGSIYHAISLINDVSEKVIDAGTAVIGAASSSTGYYKDSLYINTSTYDLWRCIGTDSWTLLGNIKGAAGKGISSIAKTSTSGLVDTYTITYSDGSTSTFDITNGEDGTDGNDGNDGVSVTGVSLLSKVGLLATYRMSFSNGTYFDYTVSDGASGSGTGDMTKAVYDTDNDGIVDAAETLQGLLSSITELNHLQGVTSAVQTQLNGKANASDIPTVDQTYSATSSNAQSGKAVAQAIGALDKSDSAVSGQYVSSVSETNGIITVSRASLPTIPTVNNGQLTIQQNGTNKATFTANQSGNATANIITDTWTETKTVSSNGTVTFSGLNDSYGYKIYYTLPSGDSAYTFSKVTKSGSGTSVTLTYTTDAPSGTVCKLRILK
jgi:hypothetical protein